MKFRIIQHFILNPNLRQNQTQIAKSLGTPQASVSRHIPDLVSLNLLHEERFGKAAVYSLNSRSVLVTRFLSRLVSLNRNFLADWVQDRMRGLPSKQANQVKKIILFGSAARADLHVSSDIDLLAITSRPTPALKFELQSLLVAGGSEEGLKINLQIESSSDYETKAERGYLQVAKREGVVLWPGQ